ncbi:MAG: hypothetical protein HN820_04885 [Candidatus Marinimicrobia bacterium]|nr:hypothetical protein [Candidatus Neomarinimicrobiota bacterium]MBT7377472.1 hypothetical protein [Candidatus Neomarinimicrobiota bacterium]
MDLLKKIFIALGSMDRRFIFLLVGLSVLLPKLYPDFFTLPIKASSHSQRVFDEIDALKEDSKILVSFEYGPSTKPEIHPSAIALLNHLFSKDIKVYAVALWPDGNFMATEAFSQVADKFGKIYGVDYVNLGYKPGGEAVVKGLVSDIRTMYTVDLLGNDIDSIEMMKDVTNLLDLDFIFSLSAGYPGSKEWVQFACDPLGIPMSTGCTSIQVTDIIPYVENDQIKGILSGMPGAAEYEQLVQGALSERGVAVSPGKASINMAAQSMAHVVIVLLIILGNITYYLTRKSGKNGGVS